MVELLQSPWGPVLSGLVVLGAELLVTHLGRQPSPPEPGSSLEYTLPLDSIRTGGSQNAHDLDVHSSQVIRDTHDVVRNRQEHGDDDTGQLIAVLTGALLLGALIAAVVAAYSTTIDVVASLIYGAVLGNALFCMLVVQPSTTVSSWVSTLWRIQCSIICVAMALLIIATQTSPANDLLSSQLDETRLAPWPSLVRLHDVAGWEGDFLIATYALGLTLAAGMGLFLSFRSVVAAVASSLGRQPKTAGASLVRRYYGAPQPLAVLLLFLLICLLVFGWLTPSTIRDLAEWVQGTAVGVAEWFTG